MNGTTPRAEPARRRGGLAVLVGVLTLTGLGAAVLPAPRVALAAPGTASQDLTIFAGPGEEYDAMTYAPAGSALSVDGEAVNGFYPVTYDGVSGWAATWAVAADGAAPAPVAAPATVELAPAAEAPPSTESVPEPAASTEVAPEPVAEPAPAAEEAAPRRGGGGGDITQIIYDAAARYGQDPEDMLRVATCESGLDPNAVGGGGAYHGLFQFVPSTFAGTPYADQSIYDPYANANAAAWMWSQGRRNEWVCQ